MSGESLGGGAQIQVARSVSVVVVVVTVVSGLSSCYCVYVGVLVSLLFPLLKSLACSAMVVSGVSVTEEIVSSRADVVRMHEVQ